MFVRQPRWYINIGSFRRCRLKVLLKDLKSLFKSRVLVCVLLNCYISCFFRPMCKHRRNLNKLSSKDHHRKSSDWRSSYLKFSRCLQRVFTIPNDPKWISNCLSDFQTTARSVRNQFICSPLLNLRASRPPLREYTKRGSQSIIYNIDRPNQQQVSCRASTLEVRSFIRITNLEHVDDRVD